MRSQKRTESDETSEKEFHETADIMIDAENVKPNALSSILNVLAEMKLTMESNQKEIVALCAQVEGCAKPVA